ncbi:MAG: PhzF family phenazine biosynthesis protein [candidate division Zixibacteria bacterium]|nr:PhzF family phenazine biosynthesis protein [candidate division Zixibacteria bacterium]
MGQKIVQVDSFASEPFEGNPAGVCILKRAADERWMQKVALEMNLSETAFLFPADNGYNLRWFTPAAEVELCGHATLASAHVLWEEGHIATDQDISFNTLSGELIARKDGEWIELDFPANPATSCPVPDGLEDALGAKIVAVGKSRFDVIVEVKSDEIVRSLKSDIGRLGELPARGTIVTSRSDGQPYDFISRFFAPAVGVAEDPVTGSAYTVLGPYWQEKLGKSQFLAYQASARGGEVRVRVDGDRVLLGGRAITVIRGELANEAGLT